MEALKQERTIGSILESSIGINGVRENDDFIIDIFQGKKKSFKLTRTKYKVCFGETFEFDLRHSEIQLPYFGIEEARYEIELVISKCSIEHNEKSRYLFKSLKNVPFRLNGIHCFEAFLERGDVLDLGLNRIHFPQKHTPVTEEIQLSEKLIKSAIPILIEGETGTGKTTLAKKIHEDSNRNGRFVHLNLSAFAPSLIESELFGHVKGAFTGAINAKRGAILEAHKGTLFLDEIDSLSLDLQTKLLLFLDSYEVRAVGSEHTSKACVRMIFASGSKLAKKVEAKEMRKDFYFRLQAGYALTLPCLSETPERIRELCHTFENEKAVTFDKELINFYVNCPWPGNIRQLHSHLMKKSILSNGKKIVFDDLEQKLLLSTPCAVQVNEKEIQPLEKVKLRYCHDIFLRFNKNISKTSKALELCPNTLKAYLHKQQESLGDNNVIKVDF